MWKHFVENMNGKSAVNLKESYYIGDAAGREKSGSRAKDFSDTDHKFAVNVGLNFKTPEMFY